MYLLKGNGYMDSREYIERTIERNETDRGGEKGGGRESERQGIGRRPRSAIRYIALQGVYRFSGSYQLSLLGDISMISARKRQREAEREGERKRIFLQFYII